MEQKKRAEQFCTSKSQSEELMKLGLDEGTADLWVTPKVGGYVVSTERAANSTPAWSLGKLIEIVKDYPTPHPEIWHDVRFFDEVYNEVCHALVDDYCWDYWSNEKRRLVKKGFNRWSNNGRKIKDLLPPPFQCKCPSVPELVSFFETEGKMLKNRDNRLGRIYRKTAKILKAHAEDNV